MNIPPESPPLKVITSPVRLRTEVSYSDNVPFTLHVRDQLANNLLHDAANYIIIDRAYDPYRMSTTFHAQLALLPLDTKHQVQSDRYTYKQQHFTHAEIDAAIQYTYPERFL